MKKNEFGDLLHQERLNAKLSMGQLARHLGVTVPYISDVELGDRAPLVRDRIIKAAELFGTDPTNLLKAASRTRGAFELDARVSPKAQSVGAALMRGWTTLTEDQLDRIERVVGEDRNEEDE